MERTMRLVDRAEFDRIACNRCGACCEGFTLNWNPADQIERTRADERAFPGMSHEESVADLEKIVDMLLTTDRYIDQEPLWTCRHFSRDAEGLGVCGIYDHRPKMCSNFPYGMPNRLYTTCSWNVHIVKHPLRVIP